MKHLLIVSKVNGIKYVYDYCSISLERIESEISHYLLTVPHDLEPFCRIQVVESASETYYELQQEDSYFQDAKFVSSLDQLYCETQKMLTLDVLDMASYVLSKFPSIHAFAIQKALYYLYTEYLCRYGLRLFGAKFVAFDNGPVDQTLYRMFNHEKECLMNNDTWKLKLAQHKEYIPYIDKILSKSVEYFDKIYMDKWQDEEYNLTHRDETPWSLAYNQGRNSVISDELILKQHYLEI